MSNEEIPQLAGEEHASHFFGIVNVHLAAEGLDAVWETVEVTFQLY